MAEARELNLDLKVVRYGTTGMLRASSADMPNLIVAGRDEDDLRDCIGPVFTSLCEARGERVQSMTLDWSGPSDRIRISAHLLPAA